MHIHTHHGRFYNAVEVPYPLDTLLYQPPQHRHCPFKPRHREARSHESNLSAPTGSTAARAIRVEANRSKLCCPAARAQRTSGINSHQIPLAIFPPARRSSWHNGCDKWLRPLSRWAIGLDARRSAPCYGCAANGEYSVLPFSAQP